MLDACLCKAQLDRAAAVRYQCDCITAPLVSLTFIGVVVEHIARPHRLWTTLLVAKDQVDPLMQVH